MPDKKTTGNPPSTPWANDQNPRITPSQKKNEWKEADAFADILSKVDLDEKEVDELVPMAEEGAVTEKPETTVSITNVVNTSIKWIEDIQAYIDQKKKEKQQPDAQTAEEWLFTTNGTDLLKLPGVYAIVPHAKWDHKVVYDAAHVPEGLRPDPAGREKWKPYIKGWTRIYDVCLTMKEHATLMSPNGEPLDIWIIDSPEELTAQLTAIHRGKWGGTNLQDPIVVNAFQPTTTEIASPEEPITAPGEEIPASVPEEVVPVESQAEVPVETPAVEQVVEPLEQPLEQPVPAEELNREPEVEPEVEKIEDIFVAEPTPEPIPEVKLEEEQVEEVVYTEPEPEREQSSEPEQELESQPESEPESEPEPENTQYVPDENQYVPEESEPAKSPSGDDLSKYWNWGNDDTSAAQAQPEDDTPAEHIFTLPDDSPVEETIQDPVQEPLEEPSMPLADEIQAAERAQETPIFSPAEAEVPPVQVQQEKVEQVVEQVTEQGDTSAIDLDLLSQPIELPEEKDEKTEQQEKESLVTKPAPIQWIVDGDWPVVTAAGTKWPEAPKTSRKSMIIRIVLLLLLLAAVALILITMFSFKDAPTSPIPQDNTGVSTGNVIPQAATGGTEDEDVQTGDRQDETDQNETDTETGDISMTWDAASTYTWDELQQKLENQQGEARDLSYQASIVKNDTASIYAKASYLKAAQTIEKITSSDHAELTQEDVLEIIKKIDYYLITARDALQ